MRFFSCGIPGRALAPRGWIADSSGVQGGRNRRQGGRKVAAECFQKFARSCRIFARAIGYSRVLEIRALLQDNRAQQDIRATGRAYDMIRYVTLPAACISDASFLINDALIWSIEKTQYVTGA